MAPLYDIARGLAKGIVDGIADAVADRLPAIVASWREANETTLTPAVPNPTLEDELQKQIEDEHRDGKVF